MTKLTDEIERAEIRRLLEGGLETETHPRADSDDEMRAILDRLRQSDGGVAGKLVVGGFTLTPVEHFGIEQACETCMYYLVHRRYCELPELALAVEPHWSCRVWRI